MSNKPLVKDYMTKEVITVPPETPNEAYNSTYER